MASSAIGGGWGSGPDYTFIIENDGAFRYEGRNHVEHKGKFTGSVSRESFDEIAEFIKDSNYMGLEDDYRRTATDVGAVYTTVVMNGKRHVVMNWNVSDGPKKLVEVEDRIDSLLEHAEWNNEPERHEGEK